MTIGERGVAIIPLPLPWGDNDNLIALYSAELETGDSIEKIGLTAFDPEAKLAVLALSGCHTLLIKRSDVGGKRAIATLDELEVEAFYAGTLGNDIQVSIVKLDEERYEVKTFLRAVLKNRQRVTDLNQLVPNKFVTFKGEGIPKEFAGEPLSGGTNGIVTETTTWPEFLKMASTAQWQCMAVPTNNTQIKASVMRFIEDQINNQGRYVTAALCDYNQADMPEIISSHQGAIIDGVEVTPVEFTTWVAGICAGTPGNESNTARIVTGATQIIGEMSGTEIEEGLAEGKFLLSYTQRGLVKVEQDINTFTSFTPEKNEDFASNRQIRTHHVIATETRSKWEENYMGQVDNNDNGRGIFQGEIVFFYTQLQNDGYITEFAGATDIRITPGIKKTAIVGKFRTKVVDAMEHAYITVESV